MEWVGFAGRADVRRCLFWVEFADSFQYNNSDLSGSFRRGVPQPTHIRRLVLSGEKAAFVFRDENFRAGNVFRVAPSIWFPGVPPLGLGHFDREMP